MTTWNIFKANPAAKEKWEAGVWDGYSLEQGTFSARSFHNSRAAAFAAARKYARQRRSVRKDTNALSWAGGVRYGGQVYWVDGSGAVILSHPENRKPRP